MASPAPAGHVRLQRLPRTAWGIVFVLVLALLSSILQIAYVRPYLWPAGTGARLADDPAARIPLLARPSDVRTELVGDRAVLEVVRGSPAEREGIETGDAVAAIRGTGGTPGVNFSDGGGTPEGRLAAWRDLYWIGVSSPVQWDVRDGASQVLTIAREPAWRIDASGWAGRHLGTIVQIAVFLSAAIVLFVLRSHDITAGLCVLALALGGVAGGGPLLGAEREIPGGTLLTVFAWMAAPLAFPVIALAILYFPARSPLLVRHPWLHAVPLVAAAPMIVPSLMTVLYLTGLDAAEDMALWDATHPGVFYGSFATALVISVLAVIEGTYRYQFNHDASERRRIRMAFYTTVPGVLAYVLKDGMPIGAALFGVSLPPYPPALFMILQALVLLPAFGLVYAVGVPGPRIVLQRSAQYALANDAPAGFTAGADPDPTLGHTAAVAPMMECPRCGRCEEFPVEVCPADRSTLRPVPHVPRTVDNKYRLEQLLGRGGMGAVYRARDMRLGRLVAVKVVRAELLRDVEARNRFTREAEIVARLHHPSIVAVHDYGTLPDGGVYLVMELVRGEDLRRMLQREGRLEPQAAMRILTAVCEAIEAAHREGVLHRDLKPENILLPGGGIDAKVLDFGVAKVLDEELPRDGLSPSEAPTLAAAAGMIIGTPAYMAPEEFQDSRVDTRTDIFSLGVIAYEMLSGELPFGRGSLGEVILAQARGAPPMRDAHLPPAAERAIRTALDTDPDRRPSSPEAFAHLLGSALGRG